MNAFTLLTRRASFLIVILLIAAIVSPVRLAANDAKSLAGCLLVAMPEMRDPRFAQTVIYIVKHDATGAMGLIINRPVARGPIGDLLKGFGVDSEAKQQIILHYGGPVEPGRGFVLHSDDYLLSDSTVVKNGIAMTADVELVRAMSLGKGPRESLFMLGYAGWAPGQLEAEIEASGWFTIAANKEFIFSGDPAKKWQQAMDKRQIPL